MGAKPSTSGPPGDVALVCGKDGRGLHILRRRAQGGPIEVAVAQPLAEGRPITGEVISLRQREDMPLLFDVRTELGGPESSVGSAGPPQVATASYREGWDAIWGRRGARSMAN